METKLLELGWEGRGSSIYARGPVFVVVSAKAICVHLTASLQMVVEFNRRDSRVRAKIPRICTGISVLLEAGVSADDLKDILHMIGKEQCAVGYRNYWIAQEKRPNLDALAEAGWVDANTSRSGSIVYSASQKTLDVLGVVISD